MIEIGEYVHPPCLWCKGVVGRREKERSSSWKSRLCCSMDCSRARQRKPETQEALEAAHEPCVICKGKVSKRKNEEVARYRQRKTCGDQDCVKMLISETGKGTDHPGDAVPREIAVVDYGNGFAAHNLKFRPAPGGVPKPFTRSYGIASGWLVRG